MEMLLLKNKKIIFFLVVNVILIIALYCIPIENSMPSICIYKNITGKECFNCGMTRAFLSVLHFNFYKAIEYNWKVVIVFPYTVIVYLYSWMKYINGGKKLCKTIKQNQY